MSIPAHDRGGIANLAVRLRAILDAADANHERMVPLCISRHQLELLEECLLTRLTIMTQHGYCWFRDDERIPTREEDTRSATLESRA